MKIGDVARQAGVSVDTLRFYEQRGLISAQRAANGYRLYSDETVQLVGYIKLAQRLGFSLAEIGENLPQLWNAQHASSERLAELFAEKIGLLDERIEHLQMLRAVLAQRAQQVCPLWVEQVEA